MGGVAVNLQGNHAGCPNCCPTHPNPCHPIPMQTESRAQRIRRRADRSSNPVHADMLHRLADEEHTIRDDGPEIVRYSRTMSKLDDACRALLKAQGEDFDALIPEVQEQIRGEIRAVFQAVREPSEGMVDRFVSRALCVSVQGEGGWSDYGRNQWQAMIDALLSE